jgi:hypothetical protein
MQKGTSAAQRSKGFKQSKALQAPPDWQRSLPQMYMSALATVSHRVAPGAPAFISYDAKVVVVRVPEIAVSLQLVSAISLWVPMLLLATPETHNYDLVPSSQPQLVASVWAALVWRLRQAGWADRTNNIPENLQEVEEALFWLALLHR